MFKAVTTDDGGLNYWINAVAKVRKSREDTKRRKQHTVKPLSPSDTRRRKQKEKAHFMRLVKLVEEGRLKSDKNTSRDSIEYRAWRFAVMCRDGFKCLRCGSKKNLNAHHCFELWAKNPCRRLDINNGATVCEDCHCLEHPFLQKILSQERRTEKQKQEDKTTALQEYVSLWTKIVEKNATNKNRKALRNWEVCLESHLESVQKKTSKTS